MYKISEQVYIPMTIDRNDTENTFGIWHVHVSEFEMC